MHSFLDDLASGSATPGGGSAAAAAGAMGTALVSMVCRLTSGRKKYADVEAQMQETLRRSEALRAELTQLISDDAQAFAALMAAFRMPKETTAEQTARQAAIQAGTKQATLTPLATVRACGEVIALCQVVVELGNPNAASDAGAGAALAQAGLKAAALNVLINLASLDDADFVSTQRAELDRLLANYGQADDIHEAVKSTLR